MKTLILIIMFGLVGCAPIIQVQPCECPQRVEVMPRGDFPDIPGDWKWYLPTYPPQEVPDYLLYEIPADAVQDNRGVER